MTILDPANPLFSTPNKITAADFEGWVEERGSKFMAEWDAQYKPLIECHDRDQAPQKGGLLEAKYGKGTFILYGGSAFYSADAGGGSRSVPVVPANLDECGGRSRPSV